MCGIAGLYLTNRDPEEVKAILHSMVSVINHRGPDDSGEEIYCLSNGAVVGFAHKRLSILDVSPLGKQPMKSANEIYQLTYNGEVYNFKEIRKTLEKNDFSFKSTSDSEVVLAAYQKWGVDCFQKFNGMWAMGILNLKNNTVVLSRDRLGIKPLYMVKIKNGIGFASEIKSLLKIPEVETSLNYQSFLDYLSYRYPLGASSFFQGIESLDPGHIYIYSPQKERKIKYWDLPVVQSKQDPGEEEVLEQVYDKFEQAVRYRMISDVPYGAYLSGGLDSSAIVATMADLSESPIRTFTIGFQEEGYNEFNYAKEVADRYHTTHTEIEMGGAKYFDLMDKMIAIKDAPLSVPNEVPLYVLSQRLKEDISVVLSGEGADELFGGYGRIFRSAFDFQRMTDFNSGKLRLSSREEALFLNNIKSKYGSQFFTSEMNHFISQYSYVPENLKLKLINPDILESRNGELFHDSYFNEYFSRMGNMDFHEKIMFIFQKVHLLGLLHRLDATTMAYAVEARVPFVDHKLIEYVSSLPMKYKMPWKSKLEERQSLVLNSNQISEIKDCPKYLLRQLFQNKLPNSIIERKKVGFPVPLEKWFSNEFNIIARDYLLDSDAKIRDIINKKELKNLLNPKKISAKNIGQTIWNILNFEMWMRKYNISIN